MVYMVVRDEADRGVYSFDSKSVAEDIATNLSSYVFMHEDEKEAALKLIGASEITDALFLIRKYRAGRNKVKKAEDKPVKKEAKTVTRASTYGERFSIIIRKLYDCGADCLKITLCSGEEYVIFLKSMFFTTTPDKASQFENASVSNPELVNKAIENGSIGVLMRSKIEYVDDFAIISDCDDTYSPDVVQVDGVFKGYRHRYNKAVINTERIESIVPTSAPDLGDNLLRSDNLVKYLIRTML